MNKRIKILIYIFAALLFSQQQCEGSFFEMTLEQDAIYTPGRINLAIKLTDQAKYDGQYQFRVSVYMAGTLFRKQTFAAVQNQPVIYELSFPEVFSRTDGRCRCELFIGEDFFESREKPFTLWPPTEPYSEQSIRGKTIWTFDTSGKLQELFDKLEVKVIDATFQPARDFGSPDIVFIGQYTDPNGMRLITERLQSVEPKPVIIYLQQKHFLKEAKLEIPAENNRPRSVQCDANIPLLNGLNMVDIMKLVETAAFIKIKKDSDRVIDSYVFENIKDEKNIFSYFSTIKQKEQISVYCQLPVTDRADPRCAVLLKNLSKFADGLSDEIKRKYQASY